MQMYITNGLGESSTKTRHTKKVKDIKAKASERETIVATVSTRNKIKGKVK